MSNKDPADACREYIKLELKSKEAFDDIESDFNQEQIVDGMEGVVNEFEDKLEDPQRRIRLFVISMRVGQAIGSKEMIKECNKLIQAEKERNEGGQ